MKALLHPLRWIPQKYVDRYVIAMSLLVPVICASLLIGKVNALQHQATVVRSNRIVSCQTAKQSNDDLVAVLTDVNAHRSPGRPDSTPVITVFKDGLKHRYEVCLKAAG